MGREFILERELVVIRPKMNQTPDDQPRPCSFDRESGIGAEPLRRSSVRVGGRGFGFDGSFHKNTERSPNFLFTFSG